MMILKTALCGAFVIVGAFTGMFYARRLTQRRIALGELVRSLQLFENEIYYTRERLEKAAARVSRASGGPAGELFAAFAELLRERGEAGAGHLWEAAVSECFPEDMPLNARDIDALRAMGRQLGSTDIKGQTENIERTLKELSLRLADAGNAEAQKGRVYRTAGVAGGILCAVLVL